MPRPGEVLCINDVPVPSFQRVLHASLNTIHRGRELNLLTPTRRAVRLMRERQPQARSASPPCPLGLSCGAFALFICHRHHPTQRQTLAI